MLSGEALRFKHQLELSPNLGLVQNAEGQYPNMKRKYTHMPSLDIIQPVQDPFFEVESRAVHFHPEDRDFAHAEADER